MGTTLETCEAENYTRLHRSWILLYELGRASFSLALAPPILKYLETYSRISLENRLETCSRISLLVRWLLIVNVAGFVDGLYGVFAQTFVRLWARRENYTRFECSFRVVRVYAEKLHSFCAKKIFNTKFIL
jgi:hypothetical protein